MILDTRYQLDGACRNEESYRWQDDRILIAEHEGQPVAVATDGRILAVVPAKSVSGEPYGSLASPKDLRRWRHLLEHEKDLHEAILPTKPICAGGKPFPSWAHVVPAPGGLVRFCIDAELLVRLQRALGAQHLILQVAGPDSPIRVEGVRERQEQTGFGAIMPIVMPRQDPPPTSDADAMLAARAPKPEAAP